MKILCAFHDIQDPGGITNHQEHLTLGLRALGHEVDARLLVWKHELGNVRRAPSRGKEQTLGALGMLYDQQFGWFWPGSKRFAYRGARNLDRWREFASQFDLVIWQIPTVTRRGDQEGNRDWTKLYDLPASVRQLAVVHDGNLPDAYPWIYAVAPHLAGLVGVHPCGYSHARKVPLPCALVPNPHVDVAMRVSVAEKMPASHRSGWFSCQTFKGWKHVADLVRAIPYMQTPRKVMAGGGIEYHYMTSKTKIKLTYLASRELDPDLPHGCEGAPIWRRATEAGMQWRGYLTNEERDAELLQSRFMIDPSWSKKYSKTGDHFNRTPIEGLLAGCVPIARDLGVATDESGIGVLFKPDENYVMVPYSATPLEFARIVDRACDMPEERRREMLVEGQRMLRWFGAEWVAQQYVNLANGHAAGLKHSTGVETPELRAASDRAMREFFGVETAACT